MLIKIKYYILCDYKYRKFLEPKKIGRTFRIAWESCPSNLNELLWLGAIAWGNKYELIYSVRWFGY